MAECAALILNPLTKKSCFLQIKMLLLKQNSDQFSCHRMFFLPLASVTEEKQSIPYNQRKQELKYLSELFYLLLTRMQCLKVTVAHEYLHVCLEL